MEVPLKFNLLYILVFLPGQSYKECISELKKSNKKIKFSTVFAMLISHSNNDGKLIKCRHCRNSKFVRLTFKFMGVNK